MNYELCITKLEIERQKPSLVYEEVKLDWGCFQIKCNFKVLTQSLLQII